MALFKRDFSKPGPGVPKNAPRKKGFGRFFEVLARDFSSLVKLNLLYLLCCLPSLILFGAALFCYLINPVLFLLFGVLALAAGCLVGPALTAAYALVTRMLRDDPSFVGHEFKRLFKENFKSTARPGIAYCLLVGSQIVGVLYYFLTGGNVGTVQVVLYMFAILLFNMAAPYFFLQAAYIEIGPLAGLQNSFRFALGFLPRTLGGMVISGLLAVALGLLIYLFPPLLILPLLVGFTVPLLIKLMWYWPQVDKMFKIDETLRARSTGALDERMKEIGEHDKVVGVAEDVEKPVEKE